MSIEKQNVIALVERMTNAFHNSDIQGVMACYENKATVVFEPETPVDDTADIRKMFESLFTMNPAFSYSGHEVFIANDIALHFAPWTMKATSPDGDKIGDKGLSVAVLRRQANGEWLMVIDNPHGQFLLNC